jgi:stearoyl-CoA desaturase (delta-9 desaturase)
MGWLLVENPELNRLGVFNRYAKDILCDRFYVWLERHYRQSWVIIGSWFLFFLGGFVAELLLGGTTKEAVQFGASLLIWGVFVRTVVVWHQTWAVNSVTHRWGYRNYATDEGSQNNLFVGIISNGEGWHNNHHADPRSAKHGHRWWELDTTYLIIRFLRLVGLARDVAVPSPHIAAARAVGRLTTRGGAAIPTD